MTDIDNWDVLILAAAGFIAVTSLVRLMLARRDQLVREIRDQVAETKTQRKKKQTEEGRMTKSE